MSPFDGAGRGGSRRTRLPGSHGGNDKSFIVSQPSLSFSAPERESVHLP
jgi:hypothetical protein